MSLVSEEKLQEIRDRIRLEDLARDYHVLLQPAGSRLRALCPFHREKTPSFYVIPDLQIFKCFGCSAGGNVFTFVQKLDNVTFPEAVEILARKAGVTLERGHGEAGGGAPRGEKTQLFEVLSLAEVFYHRVLVDDPRGEPARRYLSERGIRRESWERFRLGYALPEWEAFLGHARQRGVPAQILERAGLARARQPSSAPAAGASHGHYDYFRDRVMFPIADGMKRVIGFGARALGDEQPKYLNTPKTPVFDKSQVLYGVPLARGAVEQEQRLVIVEGYTDVVAAHQEGLQNAVASLGTAFTAQNARQLKRLTPRVELVFDGDAAGQSAAERSLDLLVAEDIDVRILAMPGGEDPCDALLARGGEAFRDRLREESVGIFEFKWRRTVGAIGEGEASAAVTARAVDQVLDLLVKVPNSVTQQLYARDIAEKLGIAQDEILKRLRKRRSAAYSPALSPAGPPRTSQGPGGRAPAADRMRDGAEGQRVSGRMTDRTAADPERDGWTRREGGIDNPSLEENVIECLLSDPMRATERWRELPADFFAEPHTRRIARAIEEELAAGSLDGARLMTRVTAEPGAVDALVSVFGRMERSRELNGADRRLIETSTEERWQSCLRDIERRALDRKRQELERLKTRARDEGDTAALLAAQRQYLQLLRQRALASGAVPPSGVPPSGVPH